MNIFTTKEFAVETVAAGRFLDEDAGKRYQVETAVIRMNHAALNDWQNARETEWRNDFDTQEEWEAYRADHKAKMEALEQKVKAALGWTDRDNASFSLTRSLSEIFTAVRIWQLASCEGWEETPVESLRLSARPYNCLKRAGIFTVSDLMKLPVDDFLDIRNLGRKAAAEIISELMRLGAECDITRRRQEILGE